ncbi:unnamed protein product [Amoebophrya sp. A25]|nr:unnamed protein product [Amoebophrya sp. A25]|eukprot:GSA25T00011439001.1
MQSLGVYSIACMTGAALAGICCNTNFRYSRLEICDAARCKRASVSVGKVCNTNAPKFGAGGVFHCDSKVDSARGSAATRAAIKTSSEGKGKGEPKAKKPATKKWYTSRSTRGFFEQIMKLSSGNVADPTDNKAQVALEMIAAHERSCNTGLNSNSDRGLAGRHRRCLSAPIM